MSDIQKTRVKNCALLSVYFHVILFGSFLFTQKFIDIYGAYFSFVFPICDFAILLSLFFILTCFDSVPAKAGVLFVIIIDFCLSIRIDENIGKILTPEIKYYHETSSFAIISALILIAFPFLPIIIYEHRTSADKKLHKELIEQISDILERRIKQWTKALQKMQKIKEIKEDRLAENEKLRENWQNKMDVGFDKYDNLVLWLSELSEDNSITNDYKVGIINQNIDVHEEYQKKYESAKNHIERELNEEEAEIKRFYEVPEHLTADEIQHLISAYTDLKKSINNYDTNELKEIRKSLDVDDLRYIKIKNTPASNLEAVLHRYEHINRDKFI